MSSGDAYSENAEYPAAWASLKYPWRRSELLLYLDELATPDPRPIWAGEARQGLVTGIDQVIHFFFDDHDFDAADVGFSLFNEEEVTALSALKTALDALMNRLPRGGADDYVSHPLWPNVTRSAIAASDTLKRAG